MMDKHEQAVVCHYIYFWLSDFRRSEIYKKFADNKFHEHFNER